MAIADPKDYAKGEKVDAKGFSVADLIEALKALKGDDDESMRKRAQFEAEARERLEEKENAKHPHISAFSYPEGDIARPKARFVCETLWVGVPLMEENETPEEIDLLNELPLGDFMFTRADGSKTEMSVVGDRDNAGRLSRKSITFACRGDMAKNLPPKTQQLREVLGKMTREQELEVEVTKLRSLVDLAALKAVSA